VSLPTAPPAPVSPTAIADAIEVTGALQVGDRWSVIVKEPNTEISRYVNPGDYLANGKVLVKGVIAGIGVDPIVILQQGGIEVRKMIGSGAIART
jgi:hypothetical protein